ncbi:MULTISPECIES: PEP-CTERM sorting domain-containing protein [unclassified Iodobacter]|uniref:PEP-CTERM sorting domain-containing protein n=1 Tax=unclassified Iodobacter TaxID=235634 RepID=UPI0025FCAC8A|nr:MULTISPECIES: PEP-CTERM sorting domain-containing protein [unclassified Iodobacter]MDW5416425.1 PEP-CTERM sorting domain-containing protein [Iodobacter sp. CM08]
MSITFITKNIAIAFSTLILSNIAQATVYSNTAAQDSSGNFILVPGLGSDGGSSSATTSFGQHFVATGETLQNFNFYASEGNRGNISFAIAAWDGQKAIGPALYTSSNILYNAGSQALGASGLNLSLTAGKQYIAYLSTAGIASPAGNIWMKSSSTNGGLNDGFASINSNGANPLSLSQSWTNSNTNLNYTATFTTPVPEPETYALLGLGLIAIMTRQRKNFKSIR